MLAVARGKKGQKVAPTPLLCPSGAERREVQGGVGSGASPLVPVRKRGCRSLLFTVSLFNQLLYNIFSTKIEFLFSLKNQEAILKEIFEQVL